MPGDPYRREPYLVVSRERQRSKEVYGSIDDAVVLQCQRLTSGRPTETALVGMHPSGSPAYLPMFSALGRAGLDVLACSSRYVHGDAGLIMEKVLLDLGACVRDARERLGYERVILFGWSGGGALTMAYQSQAEHPTITHTPAGDPCDLVGADLSPGDGVVLMAAHRGRHRVLTESLDASILDEADPLKRCGELDIYDGVNGPPYPEEFVATYRAAQEARNRRITSWARQELDALRSRGQPEAERCFVVHGTMADPRWLDPALEPNDRQPGQCFLGEPQLVNTSPTGFARFTSLRSWLSQWSLDDARADAVEAAAEVTVPVLVVAHGADDAVPTSHVDAIYDAVRHPKKELHVIPGANHYVNGPGQRQPLEEARGRVVDWLGRQG